tara:strand:- start:254 stop:1381 length:1128 start_codon:yes stop_codon:yes gene_type:complete
MRIVFVIDQVYRHGGIERVLSIKANYLANIPDYNIYILTNEQKNKNRCYEFDNKITFKDLAINYRRELSYFHPFNLIKIPNHIVKVKKSLKTINPDVIVVCSHSVDTYFLPFIKKSIPKVKEFHYSKFIEENIRETKKPRFKHLFLKFADYVESKYHNLVVLNNMEASFYKSNNVEVIPNPLTFYPETVSKLDDPIVISAGRIAPVKRYDVLIDIWELVHKKNKTWQLHIYGSGEPNYMKKLQAQIDNKKLNKTIILKGATDQIQNKMLHSSIFAMTSDNECFPLVLLEAQACGLPIVALDCPYGPKNIISSENGVLIKMNDNEGFAQAILDMISSHSKRKKFGENARQNANNYGIDKVMHKWISMFNELIKVKQ